MYGVYDVHVMYMYVHQHTYILKNTYYMYHTCTWVYILYIIFMYFLIISSCMTLMLHSACLRASEFRFVFHLAF